METKPKAIVLGGNNPHIALINNLKNRGYYTILVDYYENPPAKHYADEHIQESALDSEKVLEIAKKTGAELVLSCSVDRFISICSYVSEKLKINFPISHETSLMLTDKKLMKKIMWDNNIPTGAFIKVSDNFKLQDLNIELPVVVKPTDGEGSLGISYVDSYDEIPEKIEEALSFSKQKEVIIEEYYKGTEVQIDFFIQNKKPHILLARQKLKKRTMDGKFITLGSLVPIDLNQKLRDKFIEVAEKISSTLKINNTPLLIQAIVFEDQIKIIEFTARIGGQLSYKIIKEQTGIDMIDAFVNGVLEIKSDLNIIKSEDKLLTYIIHANKGTFNSFENYEKFIEDNIINDFLKYRTKGMKMDGSLSARSRIGAISFSGKDIKELMSKYELVMNHILSNDLEENTDLINRSLLIDFNEINVI